MAFREAVRVIEQRKVLIHAWNATNDMSTLLHNSGCETETRETLGNVVEQWPIRVHLDAAVGRWNWSRPVAVVPVAQRPLLLKVGTNRVEQGQQHLRALVKK